MSTREADPVVAEPGSTGAGNWIVLTGTLLYLSELVGIGLAGASRLPTKPATPPGEVLHRYAGHASGVAFLVGWLALVVIGRVLVIVGLRDSLRRSGHAPAWLDLAVIAMTLGVAFEVAGQGMAAGAAALAGAANDTAALALDRGGVYVQSAFLAPTGLAVLLAGAAMLRSRLFPRILVAIGLIAGILLLAAGLLNLPGQATLQDNLTVGTVVMWIWMLWTGILLARRR